jgi:hypothetical protein
MSAAEVIEQIKNLTADDQRVVRAYVASEESHTAAGPSVKIMSPAMFQRAQDHVFAHYGTLLQELAK